MTLTYFIINSEGVFVLAANWAPTFLILDLASSGAPGCEKNKLIMEKMIRTDKMSTLYESPSMTEIQLACEGVLCQSGGGTESLDEIDGVWN